MSAFLIAALHRRSVDTRRWSLAFIASLSASLIWSRSMILSDKRQNIPCGIAGKRERAAPHLLLRRGDERHAFRQKIAIGGIDVVNRERDREEAADKIAFRVVR